jgi:hypothetical protein
MVQSNGNDGIAPSNNKDDADLPAIRGLTHRQIVLNKAVEPLQSRKHGVMRMGDDEGGGGDWGDGGGKDDGGAADAAGEEEVVDDGKGGKVRRRKSSSGRVTVGGGGGGFMQYIINRIISFLIGITLLLCCIGGMCVLSMFPDPAYVGTWNAKTAGEEPEDIKLVIEKYNTGTYTQKGTASAFKWEAVKEKASVLKMTMNDNTKNFWHGKSSDEFTHSPIESTSDFMTLTPAGGTGLQFSRSKAGAAPPAPDSSKKDKDKK